MNNRQKKYSLFFFNTKEQHNRLSNFHLIPTKLNKFPRLLPLCCLLPHFINTEGRKKSGRFLRIQPGRLKRIRVDLTNLYAQLSCSLAKP